MAENSQIMRINPFYVGEDHMATADRWDEWIEELELNFRVAGITDPPKKKDVLLLYGGKEVRKLEKSLADPETSTSDSDNYWKIRTKLTEYFSPKKNKFYSRYVFLNMRPHPGESTTSYAARLRERTSGCEFNNDDERILEHLMMTSDSEELIRKVIHKHYDLKKTLEEMQLFEDASKQITTMNKGGDMIARIKRNDDFHRGQKHFYENQRYDKCKYCDRRHQKKKELCPAWGKTCSKCGKQNHFAIVCLSDSSRKERRQNSDRRKHRDAREVNRTGRDTSSDESSFESDGEYEHFMKHLKIGKLTQSPISSLKRRKKVRCRYCGKAAAHRRKEDCEAYGRRCWKCNKRDHLMKVCKSRYGPVNCREEDRHTGNKSECRSTAFEGELSSDNEYIGERITERDKLFELFSRDY